LKMVTKLKTVINTPMIISGKQIFKQNKDE